MKIRHPALIKWVGFIGALLIRWWIGTLSYRLRIAGGKKLVPNQVGFTGRYLYAFWHENILVPCAIFAQRDIKVLISQSADGEMIARISEHLGFGTIRGSSSLGGMKAMRAMIRSSEHSHIVVIPDGPRGPRRHVELGLVYLAAKTGLPIVLVGIGHDRPWRFNTWDRFVLPRPFSKAAVLALEPIHIPEDANKAQLEEYRELLERSLNEVTDAADRFASR